LQPQAFRTDLVAWSRIAPRLRVPAHTRGLHRVRLPRTILGVWNEPYLETCCRSALHRLALSGRIGRPQGLKDGPCLARLADMGLACCCPDGRFAITQAGTSRHAQEVLRRGIDRDATTPSVQPRTSTQSRSRW
jgi:hypothetical protein